MSGNARIATMPGVVFLIVVPTANFERQLLYGKLRRKNNKWKCLQTRAESRNISILQLFNGGCKIYAAVAHMQHILQHIC